MSDLSSNVVDMPVKKTVINFVLYNGEEFEMTVAGTIEQTVDRMQASMEKDKPEFLERIDVTKKRVCMIRKDSISAVSFFELDD